MNQKTASSPKEKDFPEEWKALFLGINQSLDLVEFVQELIKKIVDGGRELEIQFMNFYSEEYRIKIQQILDNKTDINFPQASKMMGSFYKKLNVCNLIDFKKRLKQIATPPQSLESRE